jgi:hypothetical protein
MNFVRAYYLSGLLGAKRTAGGRIGVTHIVTNENTAIGLAVVHWKPTAIPKPDGTWDRRDEPTWHDPAMMLPIFAARRFANIADIQAAVSRRS